MALAVSTVLFVLFAANVVVGARTGDPYLSDVSEMLLLFAASIEFVIAIMQREAAAKKKNNQ